MTQTYGLDCFSDDTGLLVDVLNGNPGVYSARYAGEQKNAKENMAKMLKEMEGEKNRDAHFKTVIHLNLQGQSHRFNGIVEGTITTKEHGSGGFGYDPIFKPEGFTQTFGGTPTRYQKCHKPSWQGYREIGKLFKKQDFIVATV